MYSKHTWCRTQCYLVRSRYVLVTNQCDLVTVSKFSSNKSQCDLVIAGFAAFLIRFSVLL